MSSSTRTEAFLLHATPYRESDLVVVLLTRRYGRVSALARGARRSRRRFGGALDYFRLLEAELRPARTGALGQLLGAEVLRFFGGASAGVESYWAGCHILEVARLGARDGDADEGLFRLVEASLGALEGGSDPGSLVRVFQTRALSAFGYELPAQGCPTCGASYRDRAAVQVGASVACVRCAGPGGRALSAGAVRTLDTALRLPLSRLGALRVPGSIGREIDPLLEDALLAALGARPRSLGVTLGGAIGD